MAEENNIGASRLIGTNGLQSAVDSLSTQVNKMVTAVQSLTTSMGKTGSGSTGGSWNTNSNRANYSNNGGGGSFSGSSFGSTGRGNGGGSTFMGRGSGGTNGLGSMVGGKLGFTLSSGAAVASGLTQYGNKNMSSMMQMNFFGTQAALAGGGGTNVAQRLAFGNNYAALNVNDAAQAAYINQYTYGNSVFNGQANRSFTTGMFQTNAFGYASPTMGATAAATAAQQTYSARSNAMAMALGLGPTIGAGGVKVPMSQIAQNLYRVTFGNKSIDLRGFNASLQQGGSLAVNLANKGAAMGWSQATQQEYINVLQGQVAAQNKGMAASKYYSLLGQAGAGSPGAQSQLKKIGIGTSAFEAQRNLMSTQMGRQEDVNETMATAFTNTTNVVNQFSSAMTAMMKTTGMDKLLGAGAGITTPLSNSLGGFAGLAGNAASVLTAYKLFSGGGGLTGTLSGGSGSTAAKVVGETIATAFTRAVPTALTAVLGTASAGVGLAAAGTLGLAAVNNWGTSIENRNFAKQPLSGFRPAVPAPSSYTQSDLQALKNAAIKADMWQSRSNTKEGNVIQGSWYERYYASHPGGSTTVTTGAAGGGSTGTTGNSVSNGSANIGANAASVIGFAETQLNVPYRYGMESPGEGFDCSSLIQWAYGKAGVKIPRVAADQQKTGKAVATNNTQPGDLLFVGNPADHVVMSIGNGKVIEAPHSGANVRIRPLNPGEFTSATRIVGAVGNTDSLLNGNSSNQNTLNNQQSLSGGDIGAYGTNEAEIIASALAGSAGAIPLVSGSKSSSGTSGTSATGSAGNGNGNNSKAALQAYAKKLLASRGWSDQWASFNALEMSEAGWQYNATNPSSGAYGLPQSLPASKMASAGSDWRTNGDTQLRWMMDYIAGRFGDPNSAWSFHQKNNWYAAGAWSIDKDQRAVVHQGEMIIPAQQAETIRQTLLNNSFNPNVNKGSGGGIHFGDINVTMPSGYTGSAQETKQIGRTIVNTILEDTRLKNLQIGQ